MNKLAKTEKAEPEVCFVIGPIGKVGTEARRSADMLFHAIIEPIVSRKFTVLRADQEQKPGLITDAIIRRVTESALVIADFSTLNANVFYELGIRHAAAKPTIHMAPDDMSLPFDNAGYRVVFYDLADWHKHKSAQKELAAQIEEIEKPDFRVTNPVTQALTMGAFAASTDSSEQSIALLASRLERMEIMLKQGRTTDGERDPPYLVSASATLESRKNILANIANELSPLSTVNWYDSSVKEWADEVSQDNKRYQDALARYKAKDYSGLVDEIESTVPF